MKKSVLGRPEGITQCIVLCVLRRQDDRWQKNLRFSSWDLGFRGIQGLTLQEDVMMTDTDQEMHRVKRATIQIPESCTQRLWAIYTSWKKPISFILRNQSLSEKPCTVNIIRRDKNLETLAGRGFTSEIL